MAHGIPRYILSSVCLIVVAHVAFSIFTAFRTTPDQIKVVPYSSGLATAFDMARKDIEGFFEIGVLVLGGLWGVAIVKKEDRLRGGDTPEIIMFICATALLGAFLYMDDQYSRILERLYWDTQPLVAKQQAFDLFESPYIRLYHSSVLRAFYAGLFASAIATFSLCLLREGHHDESKGPTAH